MRIGIASLLLAVAVLLQGSKCMPPKGGRGGKGAGNTGPLLTVELHNNQRVSMAETNLRVIETLPAWWEGTPENNFNVYEVFLHRPIKEMSYSGKLNHVIHSSPDLPKSAEVIMGGEKFVPLWNFAICLEGKTPSRYIGIDRVYITIPRTKTVIVQGLMTEAERREAEEYEELEEERRLNTLAVPKPLPFNPFETKS